MELPQFDINNPFEAIDRSYVDDELNVISKKVEKINLKIDKNMTMEFVYFTTALLSCSVGLLVGLLISAVLNFDLLVPISILGAAYCLVKATKYSKKKIKLQQNMAVIESQLDEINAETELFNMAADQDVAQLYIYAKECVSIQEYLKSVAHMDRKIYDFEFEALRKFFIEFNANALKAE